MHKVAILAFDEVSLFDVATPYEMFSRTVDMEGEACYDVVICGEGGKLRSSSLSLGQAKSLTFLEAAQTVIIPGAEHPDVRLSLGAKNAVKQAFANGARLASICSGALILAQTGILDGKTATTHWAVSKLLEERHPTINVDPNVLFVEEERLFTSAGACAGIDLCLHLIRKDFGVAVARQSARMAVIPLERGGGQAQYIAYEPPDSKDSLSDIVHWMRANFHRDLKIADLAERASMSLRTFSRQFRKQVGISPKQWLTEVRIARSRELIENTLHSVEKIAELSGFRSATSLRNHMKTTLGVTPQDYRRNFQGRKFRTPDGIQPD